MTAFDVLLNALIEVVKNEPSLVIGVVVAAVGAVFASLGIIVPVATVTTVVAYVVAVLAAAVATRSQVRPVGKL